MLFFFCLLVLSIRAEACDKPMCSIQSPGAADCHIETQDLHEAEIGRCSYIKLKKADLTYHADSENLYMNGLFALKVRKGAIRKYRNIMIEVRPWEMKTKYLIRIGMWAGMEKEHVKVTVSCLKIFKSVEVGNVDVKIAGELIQTNEKDGKCWRKIQAALTLSVPPSSSTALSAPPSSSTALSAPPSSSTALSQLEDQCSMDSRKKTMTHRWKKLENIKIEKCCFINDNHEEIPGHLTENNGIISCVAKYNLKSKYYSRIYYRDLTTDQRNYPKACVFNETTLHSNAFTNSPSDAAVSETSDSTLIVVASILAFGSVLLLSFIAAIFYNRNRPCMDRELYSEMNVTGHGSAMIITVDEYNKDISQLKSLLKSHNIEIAESSCKEDMMNRHDWLEWAVSNSNHYIFIVTKQMGEIFNEPLSEEREDRMRLLTECEDGTCAYTVNLIRNKFIKSRKNPGSCHLVSFEEEDEKVVSQLKHGLQLFQNVRTHCYHLYTGKRFRYNAACSIINNIKKIE